MRALGFDVKKAEVQQIMRDYASEEGLIAERDFVAVGEHGDMEGGEPRMKDNWRTGIGKVKKG